MKELNPKVSIVIPVYNGANFMGEAIDSALAQTYKNIEVVVVNDGSTDGGATDAIARSYGDRIRYFPKKNGGVATALNFGIQKMKGSYFSWLSHDDMYEKTKVEEQVKLLNTFDTDVIVACNARVLFSSGISKNEYIDKDTFDFTDIFLATSAVVGVNGCALLIPRKALVESGGFDANLPVTQDYDLWFRLKDKYEFALLEKNLVISRRHDQQDSVQKQKMCLVAGDDLHYDFLNDVPYERFEQFFKQNDTNLGKYWDNYTAYKLGGFKKTASMMLKHLARYYFENDTEKFNEVLRSEIGLAAWAKLAGKPKTKKRLLFYSNVWHRGGIERVLSSIFTHFGDEYDFILATNVDNSADKKSFPLPKSVSRIEINNHNQLAELMSAISLLDVDLFVGNPNYSETFLDIYPLLEKTKVKSIAYNHGHYLLPYMCGAYLYPTSLKVKESFGAADHVVWLSQTGCNIYNLENNNGVYIPNPVANSPKSKPKTRAAKRILAVGRFDDEVKQIDKTLLVFKELYKIDQDYQLDIVGHCPMDTELLERDGIKLGDFIAEQNIPTSNVKFWGEQADVSKFYEDAGFLVLTSRCEGFALVLVEALSKGTPCAVFEYLGVDEIVQDGYNGLVSPQDDYAGLARNIAKSIGDEATYSKMSRNALGSVDKFEPKLFYARWKKLIEATLGNRGADAASLRPDNKLTADDYKKIVMEYEKLLNTTVKNYLTKENKTVYQDEQPGGRMRGLARRVRTSLRRDGLYLTGEKIVRKLSAKAIKRKS